MNNKQIITLIVVAVAAMAVGYFIGTGTTSSVKSENQITLKNQTDSLNYFLGLNWAYNLLTQAPWEPDAELLASGLIQVMNDSSSYDQATADMIFRELNMALQEEEAGRAAQESIKNLEEGMAFLEENANKEGVISLESGLQYEVITMGDGPKPTDTSTVSVFYEGTLIDGTVFDSSYDTGDTISFPLNGVIPGWTEGLQLMPVGSTFKFFIPSELAYGSRATGPIPANSTLIFKVELIDVE
jgi:FKBP-type peptidyl-prolyl cis-trans isomerase FkpA